MVLVSGDGVVENGKGGRRGGRLMGGMVAPIMPLAEFKVHMHVPLIHSSSKVPQTATGGILHNACNEIICLRTSFPKRWPPNQSKGAGGGRAQGILRLGGDGRDAEVRLCMHARHSTTDKYTTKPKNPKNNDKGCPYGRGPVHPYKPPMHT